MQTCRTPRSSHDESVVDVGSGEPVLPAEHRSGSDHQAEGDPPGRVQSVHAGRQGHAHPDPPTGDPVCPAALQTAASLAAGGLHVHHRALHALPGECTQHAKTQ